jgi:hypothetical protein
MPQQSSLHHQRSSLRHNSFLKPFCHLYRIVAGIPFEIRSRKVPRVKKMKKRIPGMLE